MQPSNDILSKRLISTVRDLDTLHRITWFEGASGGYGLNSITVPGSVYVFEKGFIQAKQNPVKNTLNFPEKLLKEADLVLSNTPDIHKHRNGKVWYRFSIALPEKIKFKQLTNSVKAGDFNIRSEKGFNIFEGSIPINSNLNYDTRKQLLVHKELSLALKLLTGKNPAVKFKPIINKLKNNHPLYKSINIVSERGLKIGTIESCTGGYIGNAILSLPKGAKVFAGTKVLYSENSKKMELKIPESAFDGGFVYSRYIAKTMAIHAQSFSDVLITTTGLMETSDTRYEARDENLPGTVHAAIKIKGFPPQARTFKIKGRKRSAIKRRAMYEVSQFLLEELQKTFS